MELKYKLDEDETGLVVTGGEDLVGELVIPAEHDFHGETYPVTSIYHEAFNGCTELTSVIIPETVVAIGYWAFGGCSGLNSIKIPNSVRSIRPDAFYNTGLYNNNENWSEGVLYIGDCLIKAKKECLSATYKIKEGTRLIADEAFENCGNLTEVVIDPTIQYIGIGAFYNCRQLSVVIADRKYPLYIEKKSLEDGTHSSFQDCKNVIKQCGRFKIKDMEDAPTSSSEPYNPYRWIYKVLSIPFTILLSPLSLLLWPVYLVGTSDVKKKLLREKGEKLQWYKVIGIFLLLIIMVLVSINNWIAKLFENIVAFLVKPFKKNE